MMCVQNLTLESYFHFYVIKREQCSVLTLDLSLRPALGANLSPVRVLHKCEVET